MIIEGQFVGPAAYVAKDVLHALRLKPFVHVFSKSGAVTEQFLGRSIETATLDYRISFPALKNQEFVITFKLLLDECLRQEDHAACLLPTRVKRFYRNLLRLDKVFTSSKRVQSERQGSEFSGAYLGS
jgi:hypothetical protein